MDIVSTLSDLTELVLFPGLGNSSKNGAACNATRVAGITEMADAQASDHWIVYLPWVEDLKSG